MRIKKRIIFIIIIVLVVFFMVNILKHDSSNNTNYNESDYEYVSTTKNIFVIVIRFIDKVLTLAIGAFFSLITKLFELIFGVITWK